MGDFSDLTQPDVYGFRCWNCGTEQRFDDEYEYGYIANGRPTASDELKLLKKRIAELETEIEDAHEAADGYVSRYRKCDGYPLATLSWRVYQLVCGIVNLEQRQEKYNSDD